MDRLGEKHIEFLRQAHSAPFKKHSSDLPFMELQQMVDEGLLIKYSGNPIMFAITKAGSAVAKSFGASPELVKLAKEFVMSRGYSEEAADNIIKEYGAEHILRSKAEEASEQSSGQRGIKAPTDANGNVTFKPIQS